MMGNTVVSLLSGGTTAAINRLTFREGIIVINGEIEGELGASGGETGMLLHTHSH